MAWASPSGVKSSGWRYCADSSSSRITSPGYWSSSSCTVKKLPSDLLIFSPEMFRKPLCIQYFAMMA